MFKMDNWIRCISNNTAFLLLLAGIVFIESANIAKLIWIVAVVALQVIEIQLSPHSPWSLVAMSRSNLPGVTIIGILPMKASST